MCEDWMDGSFVVLWKREAAMLYFSNNGDSLLANASRPVIKQNT